ncbi:MAG: chemotaxis protein CheD [candidate division Zixibacteria bacterium]|nr:chemotaxis protein CheD [candidate division Zixibacteria bacterium]
MQLTIGIGEMAVTKSPEDVIITHALGSCLGITLYDPVANVGGMLHALLPSCSFEDADACKKATYYIDAGTPLLFKACYKLGAKKQRLIVRVAGGARTKTDPDKDMFQIGRRNFTALRKILWKNGVLINKHDVGGTDPRTMTLVMSDGGVKISSKGKTTNL